MTNFKMAVVKLAAYYEKDLSDEQILMYAEQLNQFLSIEELQQAIKVYINNPENEFFPRPVSKLIALVKKPVENKDQAQNVLNIIKKAVVSHQSTWLQGYFDRYDEARQPVWVYFDAKGAPFNSWREAAIYDLGELAVAVIERLGGWKHICERFDQEPDGVVTGQLIKNIEAILNIAEVGQLENKPSLPQPSQSVLQLVNIKSLNSPEQ